MFRLISRATIICALCISIGAHWVALQSVAWGTAKSQAAPQESNLSITTIVPPPASIDSCGDEANNGGSLLGFRNKP